MTNRDLMKLIQLSPEKFAELLDDQITELMNGGLCEICMARHGGVCPNVSGEWDGCQFDLAAWLREEISNEKLVAAAVAI